METVSSTPSCRVMTPEYTGHEATPHAQVTCVECHVAPGSWAGSRQGSRRTPAAGGRLRQLSAADTVRPRNKPHSASAADLERHWRDKPGGARLRLITKFAEDGPTPSQTVLHHANWGQPSAASIASMGPASVQCIRTSPQRQVILGRVRTTEGRVAHLLAGKAKERRTWRGCRSSPCSASTANRTTHAFDSPERDGQSPRTRPAVYNLPCQKTSVEVLRPPREATRKRRKIPRPSTSTTKRRIRRLRGEG